MTPRTRHVPMRRCVRCRTSAPKAEMLRVARTEDGTWRLDPTGDAGGRGAWLCPDCAARATEKELRRAFRASAAEVAEALDRHVRERPAREG
jgi:predicted RNA-binding protein YlxR (DUF448 family)